jgi:hypothetical protein
MQAASLQCHPGAVVARLDRLYELHCWQDIGFGCLCIASLTAIQGQALFLQFLTCGASDVFVKQNGRWQRALSQLTRFTKK